MNRIFRRTVDVLVIVSLIILASSCSGVGLKPDKAMADLGVRDTLAVGDPTLIISGCGNQPISGYTFCRMTEGDTADQLITLHVPPAQCRTKPCVTYVVLLPDGSEIGNSAPDGKTTVDIKWKDLFKRDKFQIGDRGFYRIILTVNWVDDQGHDRVSMAEGEIRLRVVASQYRSLREVARDPAFVWAWTEGPIFYRMTTALRSYVGNQ